MAKAARVLSNASSAGSPHKRVRPNQPRPFIPIKVATAEAAAAVDNDPPLHKLLKAAQNAAKTSGGPGDVVVYWMRMNDLRISDNRALSLASKEAHGNRIPLVVLFCISPQDYIAHDRSPRRIDFTLRNLASIKENLETLNIPLCITTHTPRKTLPSHILSTIARFNCKSLYANIEYEVDELRRDIEISKLSVAQGMKVTFAHDKCVVEPGAILTKEQKTYAVYSPYQRNWLKVLNSNLSYYLEDCPKPHANPDSVRSSKVLSGLFDTSVPPCVPGFELKDDDREKMKEIWPAGEDNAKEILERFLHTKSRASQIGASDPLSPGVECSSKLSRISKYSKDRDVADRDTTSRLSPYLSAGVISARACVRATMLLLKIKTVDASRDSTVGRWVQEVAWRDFYACVLAGYPRVSMGRPFLEKFSSVAWEDHQAPEDTKAQGEEGKSEDSEALRRWKEGKTGIPIVDAGMRCMNDMGWMHNRLRMICAMFLTKDLMIDWRVGERYFMQNLIDGDLASNNGGWQWSASTGVDPCPYFRIFNPYNQSLKADPKGEFIRHWVPELRKIMGPDIHKPSSSAADKLGYPRPIVIHEESRQRALRRFQNPGEK